MTPALRATPLLLLGLSACADIGLRSGFGGASDQDPAQVATSQDNVIAEQFAAELSARIGEDLGGGSRILNARAEGSNIFVSFLLPLNGADIPEAERTEMSPGFAAAAKEQFCSTERGRAFLDTGNTLYLRFEGTDGVALAEPVLSSCA